MDTTLAPSRRSFVRAAYGALTVSLLVAVSLETVEHGTGYWQLAAFGLGPDLALLLGAGRGLARGHLHPRAVPVYNAVHRFVGPAMLGVIAAFDVVGVGFVIGALAWALHISLDRTVGYGLRNRDGFQRP